MIKILSTVVLSVGVVFISFTMDPQDSLALEKEWSQSYYDAQAQMSAKLLEYQNNADFNLRVEITQGHGFQETPAGKIFRAFNYYCQYAGIDIHYGTTLWEEAKQDLFQNPQLTLSVLLPVLREQRPNEDKYNYLFNAREIIENLVLEFSLREERPFAALLLKKWSIENPRLEWKYDYYLKYNLNIVSNRYKQQKKRDDLERVVSYILLPRLKKDVLHSLSEKYLGSPDFSDSMTEYYKCSDDEKILCIDWWAGNLLLKISWTNKILSPKENNERISEILRNNFNSIGISDENVFQER